VEQWLSFVVTQFLGSPQKKKEKEKIQKKNKKLFEENQKIYKWEKDTRMPRK